MKKVHHGWIFDMKTACKKDLKIDTGHSIERTDTLYNPLPRNVTCINCRKKLAKYWLIKEDEIYV